MSEVTYRRRKAGPVTLALGLIIVGCMLLAANLLGYGVLTTALNLWPVLLVGLGVEYFIRSYFNKHNNVDEAETKFHIPTVIIILFITALGFMGQQITGLVRNDDLKGFINEAVAGSKYNYTKDSQEQILPVKPGFTKIRISSRDARVDLVPSTDGKLHVQTHVTAWAPTVAEAKRRAEMIGIKINEGQVIDISHTPQTAPNLSRQAVVSYRLTIPAGVDVGIDNATGEIRAERLVTNLSIDSQSASMTLSEIKGNIKIDGNDGQIRCRDIDGTVEGSVDNGNISVRDVSKDVRISSENGRVEVSSSRPVSSNYNVNSKTGEILFSIPDSSDATLYAKTNTGTIHGTQNLKMDQPTQIPTEPPAKPERPEEMSQQSGSVVLGSGKGVINLFSENGSITVNKL